LVQSRTKAAPGIQESLLRIASYVHDGRRQVGVVSPDGLQVTAFRLAPDAALRGALPLVEAAARGEPLPGLEAAARPMASVRLAAPMPLPRRNLWCVGRNYHAHARELASSVFKDNSANVIEWPIVFTKAPETVIGPTDEVALPGAAISAQIDYEAELTLVIGKGGKNIRKADWREHVFGYTIINDVTARDVQMRHQQWDLGKSFDTFCPMGPWIVTADELDATNTRVRCWVNGELRQDARTDDLIFDLPTLVETVSRGITLHPGDLIATGSPAGVGMGFKPPKYLGSGDVVRIEIDGLGVIENKFV
jgi:2-keto-4-pentenoate hydratase/2-oxohepta-3-ene-1,7-dioic acid hydratase in catechol pathway